jgi:hypothetical protein
MTLGRSTTFQRAIDTCTCGHRVYLQADPAAAEQQLAMLEDICLVPCTEIDDLKRAAKR